MGKKIIIIAGPNGAGKTTFAREFLPNEAHCPIFINADLIAAGLAPFSPETAAIKAARLVLGKIEANVKAANNFSLVGQMSAALSAVCKCVIRRNAFHFSALRLLETKLTYVLP
jgi:predicted ABC-type ATPase